MVRDIESNNSTDTEDDRSRLNVYIVFSAVVWIPSLIMMNMVFRLASSRESITQNHVASGTIPLLFLMGLCTMSGVATRELTSDRSVSRRIVTILAVCQGVMLTSSIQTYLSILKLCNP